LLVTVDDEELHRSHFYWRSRETRPKDRYLQGFKKIRRLQKYMISSASIRGVPRISHYDLDATLSQILDLVMDKALETAASGAKGDGHKRPIKTTLDRPARARDPQERSITT
jgi:2-phosphoglycerate kinase